MAEILDFSKASQARQATGGAGAGAPEQKAPQPGQTADLSYPPRQGTVAVELHTTPDLHAHLDITAPASLVRMAMDLGRTSLARAMGVDVRDLAAMQRVEQTLGADAYDVYITSFTQRQLYESAVRRTGLVPFLTPEYLTDDMPAPDADYSFSVDALMHPRIGLTSYDPVSVEFPKEEQISSADVTAYLKDLSEQLATFEPDPARKSAQVGDRVLLRIKVAQNGTDIPGGTQDQMPYEVGCGMLPQEVDEGLEQMGVGDCRTFSVSLPTGVDADGTPQFFMTELTVTLLEVDRRVPARIDDGWVARNMPQAGTLLGFRSQVRQALEREAKARRQAQLAEMTSLEAAKRLDGDIPQDFIDRSRAEALERTEIDLQRQGASLDDYLQQTGTSREDFEIQVGRQADDDLRRALALDAVADHLDIKVTDAEASAILGQASSDREQEFALKTLRETGQLEQIRTLARRIKANQWLVDNAKDSSGPHLQLL